MADYHYDEAGNMAAYFLISFLFIILVPLTLSLPSSSNHKSAAVGCQCQPCLDQQSRIQKREGGSILKPKLAKKTIFLSLGWALFGYLAYKASNAHVENKVYNPFEILGLDTGSSEKEIKSHYKQLSRKYHPDKVKMLVNETAETVAAKFVELTKAYKSLTDETIRSNYEKYGHPDGRQPVSMGIALPAWVIEGKNNIWVLGLYGVIFGAALPALVGRWWFGNRQKTKDGVNAKTAAAFFTTLKEEWGLDEVIGVLGKGFSFEVSKAAGHESELNALEIKVREELGVEKWEALTQAAEFKDDQTRRAIVLLYAHLFRLSVEHPALRKEQTDLLLRSPNVMNALLNISLSRNWLAPSLAAMRLNAYLTQAVPLPPRVMRESDQEYLKFAQLPGIELKEVPSLKNLAGFDALINSFEASKDARVPEIKKAVQKWGKLEVVDTTFKVIGEKIVTPLAIIFLVVKLRIPTNTSNAKPLTPEEAEAREDEFLLSKKEAEDSTTDGTSKTWAHTPHWPSNRKQGWWLVLADVKSNRIIVPPMKITDVPYTDSDYRSYKLQFQAPQNVGLYTWRAYIVSDTFVGEEIARDVTLQVDDVSALGTDAVEAEDDISDPEEDSLAGQMAAMRGGSVKKASADDSDDSDTDGEGGGDDSSDSD